MVTQRKTRPKGERPLGNEARKLRSQVLRQDEIIERASMAAAEARDDLARLHLKTEKRFKMQIPQDALLLDVLQQIEVVAGNRWIWSGIRNNVGLATVRQGASEQSLVRYLAIMFGVLQEGQHGMLFPKGVGRGRSGDTEDVNPFHRVLRESETPIGNPKRYNFA